MKLKQLTCVVFGLLMTFTAAKRHTPLSRPSKHAELAESNPLELDLLAVEAEQSALELLSEGKKPKVEKFMGNIYEDMYYSESALAIYVQAFYDGYNMQDYAFAEECLEYTTGAVDEVHEFNLNMTRRFSWVDPYFLVGSIIGNEFNDSWFYCYQFANDVKQVYVTKFENFVDGGDIYLSMLFNLLANSLHIKNASENIIDALAIYDTKAFITNLASIIRITVDFDSYQTAGESAVFVATAATTGDRILKGIEKPANKFLDSIQEKKERKQHAHKKLSAYREENKKTAKINASKKMMEENNLIAGSASAFEAPVVEYGEGYAYGTFDYIQAPFAFLIGALHALPDESFGYKCSKNTTSSRNSLLESFEFFQIGEELEAFTALHDSISYFDEMDLFCFYAIETDLSEAHWTNLFSVWWEIPVNLLYNAGHMWVDAINYIFYTPSTVPQGDWGFFVVYLIGDFAMRFFYRDETPN